MDEQLNLRPNNSHERSQLETPRRENIHNKKNTRHGQLLRNSRRHCKSETDAGNAPPITIKSMPGSAHMFLNHDYSKTHREHRNTRRHKSESSIGATNEQRTENRVKIGEHSQNIENDDNQGILFSKCASSVNDDNEEWTYIDETSSRKEFTIFQPNHLLISPHDSLDAPIYKKPYFEQPKAVTQDKINAPRPEIIDHSPGSKTCYDKFQAADDIKGKTSTTKCTQRSNSTPDPSYNKAQIKQLSRTLPAKLDNTEINSIPKAGLPSVKSKRRSSDGVRNWRLEASCENTEMKGRQRPFCSIHMDRTIRVFCKDHSVLCCRDCMKDSHRKCQFRRLDDLVTSGTSDRSELKQTSGDFVKKTIADMINTRRELKIKQEAMSKQEQDVMHRVKENTDKMIDKIRQLERTMMEHVHETFRDKQKHCESYVQKCDNFIYTFSLHFQQLGEPKTMKENSLKRLETFRQLEKTIKTDHKNINKLLSASTNSTENCVFEENSELTGVIGGASKLGDLVFNVVANDSIRSAATCSSSWLDNESDIMSGSCTEDEMPFPRVVDHGLISTWTSGDKTRAADIACIKELKDGSILVCDTTNKKIKWFKYEGGCLRLIAPALKFSFKPWHVEHIKDSMYIVTFPSAESYIELHATDNDLIVGKPVSLGGNYPISRKVDNAIVFLDTVNVNFLTTDLDGSNHRETFDQSIRDVLERPNYMLYSPETKLLYVNDPDKGVFGISMERKELVFNYTDRLKCPMEIAFGADGNLLVINNQTSDVHAISKYDGEVRYIISLANVPELGKPQCICYLPRLNEYLLSFTECYNMIRFKVAAL